jgi:hypothetical protein
VTDYLLYLLLDANIFTGYYARQTLTNAIASAGPRIGIIIDSVRRGCSTHIKLLVPEIGVAEAQTVLSKHANPKWKGPKKKKDDPQSIHGRTYQAIVRRLRDDLHGGRLIESVPLQRYHVLAKQLITPIDHQLRLKTADGSRYVKELGGTDQLIGGMAIWLTRLLGQEWLVVLTTDYRLAKVMEKARRVRESQAKAWGIFDAARDIGIEWHTDIYPRTIHLARASEEALRRVFRSWPLPLDKRMPRVRCRAVTGKEVEILLTRNRAIGIGRDRLPYSPQMTALTNQFNDATGHSFTEVEVWGLLIDRLKRGGGSLLPAPLSL